MATIRKVKGKRGTVYRAIIRRKGQSLSKAFTTKTDAKNWAIRKEADIDRDCSGLVYEGQRRTLTQAIARYGREILPSKSEGTRNAYGTQLEWWKGRIGSRKLADITPQLISQCRDKLAAENIAKDGEAERYR
ncbi:MAG: site-specific integrase, partial [Gammaproteobacteria bacterium]